MATAIARTRVGSAPDSWGVWFPHDPKQVPWQRFLDELAAAGYTWLELGPYGYLPTDAPQLLDELARRGLRVSGGTVGGALHRPSEWDSVVSSARQVAELTVAVGAEHLVFLPGAYRDGSTDDYLEPPQLDAESWRTMTRSADALGKLVREEYGLRLVFHPHADTHVQTQGEIERFLDDTDPSQVSLCLDTGHVSYGGGDNVALIRAYADRIGYVHIKQMDQAILADVRAKDQSFGEAVRRGVSIEPPGGEPDIGTIVDALGELDNDRLFVIVEQDLYPCAPEVPLPIATRTLSYLRHCGLGSAL